MVCFSALFLMAFRVQDLFGSVNVVYFYHKKVVWNVAFFAALLQVFTRVSNLACPLMTLFCINGTLSLSFRA